MITASQLVRSLFGAYCLAFLDRRGMAFFDRTRDGARHSFFAAVLVLPPYVLVQFFRLYPDAAAGLSFGRIVTVELIAYVISWTAFPVLMLTVVRSLGKPQRYFDFLVAYNWSGVVQAGVWFPIVFAGRIGLITDDVAVMVGYLTMAALLFYQWFVLRVSLEVGGSLAAMMVLIDLMISLLLGEVSDRLIGIP